MTRTRWIQIFIITILVSLLLVTALTISFGAENISILRVFSVDEETAVNMIQKNITKNDLNPRNFYNYGYLYFSIGIYILKALKFLDFAITQRLIILVMRYISFLAALISAYILYTIFLKIFSTNKIYSLMLSLCLLSMPDFSFWSAHIHPDILQVMWVLLAVWFAFQKHDGIHTIAATAMAGLAFGTKYSGVFILPFLFIPYCWNNLATVPRTRKTWIKMSAVFIIGILVFLAAWLVTNPYVLGNFKSFYRDISFEQIHVARGHGFADSTNPLLWFSIVIGELGSINGIILLLGFLLAGLWLVGQLKKEGLKIFSENPLHRNLTTLFVYVVATFGHLMIYVNMREVRFLFHILPFFLVVAFYGIFILSQRLEKYSLKNILPILLLVPICLLAIQTEKTHAIASKKYDHPFITMGHFLSQSVSSESIVLANSYSYIPPNFKQTTVLIGINQEKIDKFKPDVLALNFRAMGRWAWKNPKTTFKDLNFFVTKMDNAAQYGQFLKDLVSPGSGWEIIYETEITVILKRKKNQ